MKVSTKKEKIILTSFLKEEVKEMRTINDMLRWTISRFNAALLYYGHGTNNPLDEALHLILPTLCLPLQLPTNMYNTRLTFKERSLIANRVMQRVNARIPVPYLTNTAWFCELEFYVDNRVIIPRSPIGELISNRFYGFLSRTPRHILDMCTGSGCIAIACSYSYPEAEIDAVDISRDALVVAEKNIQEYGLEQKITPICSDLFYNLPPLNYDIIIVNPPYVDQNSMKNLPKEFQAEPSLGLDGGIDGLNIVRQILFCSPNYLTEDGILVCEVGNSMEQLKVQYPQVPFFWVNLARGGHGVFILTKKQLNTYIEVFNK